MKSASSAASTSIGEYDKNLWFHAVRRRVSVAHSVRPPLTTRSLGPRVAAVACLAVLTAQAGAQEVVPEAAAGGGSADAAGPAPTAADADAEVDAEVAEPADSVPSERATASHSDQDTKLLSLLLRLLDPDHPEERALAVQQLALAHDARAAEPLQFALAHDEPRVRLAAAQALGAFRGPRVEDALHAVLASARAPVELRVAAARSLGDQRTRRAAELLFRQRRPANEQVRTAVHEVLETDYAALYAEWLVQSPADVDRSGRVLLVPGMALHGGYAMTALAEIAGGEPGVLSFVGGAAIGGVTPYLLSMRGELTKPQAAWLVSTTTWGWASGIFVASAGDAGSHGVLGASIAGQTVGLIGGLLSEEQAPETTADIGYLNLAGLAGMAAGGGIATLHAGSSATTSGLLQTGLTVGLLGGGLALSQAHFDLGDAPVVAETTLAGTWVGAWTPYLFGDDDTLAREHAAGALFGAATGFVAGSFLAKGADVTVQQTIVPLYGAVTGSALGGGAALMLSDELSQRSETALLLGGGGLGVGLSLALAEDRLITPGERVMMMGAATWGTWQGFGLGGATDAGGAERVGDALFGLGVGAALSGLATRYVHPSVGDVAVVLSGGAWGGWLSGWTTYVVQKHDDSVQDDDVLLAAVLGSDAGLVLGALAISPWLDVPAAQLGWINLGGALGMGIGTSVMAVSGDHIAEGNVVGTTTGLVASAIVTSFLDFDDGDDDASADSASVASFLASLTPTLTWAPAATPRGKPVPVWTIAGVLE